MTTIPLDGVGVECCSEGCGGLWFDRAELQRVGPRDLSMIAPLVNSKLVEHSQIDSHVQRKCPKCVGEPLIRVRLGFEVEVEIDVCLQCAGVWLDHGELEIVRGDLLGSAEALAREAALEEGLMAVKRSSGEGAMERLAARTEQNAILDQVIGWIRSLAGSKS